MLQQIGGFIGSMAADVVNLFRGRQAVPCLVDWDEYPEFPFRHEPVDATPLHRDNPDTVRMFTAPVGLDINWAEPTVEDLRKMTPVQSIKWNGFAFEDDDCGDCEGNCCLATDTIGEIEGKA